MPGTLTEIEQRVERLETIQRRIRDAWERSDLDAVQTGLALRERELISLEPLVANLGRGGMAVEGDTRGLLKRLRLLYDDGQALRRSVESRSAEVVSALADSRGTRQVLRHASQYGETNGTWCDVRR